MIKNRNVITLLICVILSIILSLLSVLTELININNLLIEKNNLLYNLDSLSAVIAGFSFTSISVLISVIDKERIKRLWDNHYLDNLTNYSFISIFCNTISICLSLYTISLDQNDLMTICFLKLNIIIFIMGIFFFVVSAIKFGKLVRKIKDEKSTYIKD